MSEVKENTDDGHCPKSTGPVGLYALNQCLTKTNLFFMDKAQGNIVSLSDLLALEAGRIMEGEKFLVQALPTWIRKTFSSQLRDILIQYQTYIEHHAEEMNNFFLQKSIISSVGRNRVIRALIDDANEKLRRCADPEIYDACLLAAIQEINHYKISIYGTVTAYFNQLAQRDTAGIFLRAEKDEKRIDEQLSFLAQADINELAKAPVIK